MMILSTGFASLNVFFFLELRCTDFYGRFVVVQLWRTEKKKTDFFVHVNFFVIARVARSDFFGVLW